ncbi:MAG: NAD(P)-dependent oxidoreductase [Chloroflexi bacterium]|nr:NAD(P)-dependent oxidoreductase [Chloroflexota bacterium]
MRVGFVGLGKMGRPMALNLLKAGHSLVVHNRSRAVVDELAGIGAQAAFSPAEMTSQVEMVLTCLPTPQAVEEVYLGQQGIVFAARDGQMLVDHSTVGPSTSRKLAGAASAKGAVFLDAPVSGGPAGAQAGTLTVMVGGDVVAFERARSVFEAFGKNIRYVGGPGAGSVVKLANQLMVAINIAGVAEAMVLGTKGGVDPAVMFEVLSTSFGGSAMLSRAVPLFLARNFVPGTPVSLILKDLGLITALGEEVSVRLLMGHEAQDIFYDAATCGHGEQDMAAVVLPLEGMAGTKVVAKGQPPGANLT